MFFFSIHLSGTKDYTIEGSDDEATWSVLHTGTLTDPQSVTTDVTCDQPLVTIEKDEESYNFRYIKFTATTYYGKRAALQYLGLTFVDGGLF